MYWLVLALATYEGCLQLNERMERWEIYHQAESDARARRLPLMVVGCPKWFLFSHGYGDMTLDIQHNQFCRCPNPVTLDIREIDRRLKPKSLVIFSSHVLEHLEAGEARRAMIAIDRVAVSQYHVFPSRWSIAAQLAPGHKCWPVVSEDGRLTFEERDR